VNAGKDRAEQRGAPRQRRERVLRKTVVGPKGKSVRQEESLSPRNLQGKRKGKKNSHVKEKGLLKGVRFYKEEGVPQKKKHESLLEKKNGECRRGEVSQESIFRLGKTPFSDGLAERGSESKGRRTLWRFRHQQTSPQGPPLTRGGEKKRSLGARK